MSETTITKAILDWLHKEERVFAWKVHQDMYSIPGIPDIVGVWDGDFFALEVKDGKNVPTKIQHFRMEQMRRAGAFVAVVYSKDEAQTMLQRWRDVTAVARALRR